MAITPARKDVETPFQVGPSACFRSHHHGRNQPIQPESRLTRFGARVSRAPNNRLEIRAGQRESKHGGRRDTLAGHLQVWCLWTLRLL